MSNLPATTRNAPTRGLLVRLENGGTLAIAPDGERILCKVSKTVRLQFGPELYACTKNVGLDDKCMPYQPGYMKLVAAMGGQLACPPVMRDPLTGDPGPNPKIDTYEGMGVIRQVTATAVCVVPNPETGALIASIQAITVDAEHILRQALLKIPREDAVQVLSREDIEIERKAGKLRGWTVIPLTPPFAYIVANMGQGTVREAFQTFAQQSATIRQRSCTKAERLACDHNPITRMSWLYGDLLCDIDVTGRGVVQGVKMAECDAVSKGAKWVRITPPYVDVPVVAWVEHRGQRELEAMLHGLATDGHAQGVADAVVLQVDATEEENVIDDEPDDAPRALPDHGPQPDLAEQAQAASRGERVPAGRVDVTEAVEQPKPTPTPPVDVPVDPAVAKLAAKLSDLELMVADAHGNEAVLAAAAEVHLVEGTDLMSCTPAQLRAYQGALLRRAA